MINFGLQDSNKPDNRFLKQRYICANLREFTDGLIRVHPCHPQNPCSDHFEGCMSQIGLED